MTEMDGPKPLQAEISYQFASMSSASSMSWASSTSKILEQRKKKKEKKVHSTVLIITIILVLAEPKNVRLTTPLCLKEANPY